MNGTSKTAEEILSGCTKFQCDATVAQICSTQQAALGIRRELSKVIPTASLNTSCTAF